MAEATTAATHHDNADLLEQLDKEPERNEWKPETEGDTILGTLSSLEHPKTKDGRFLPVLILETEDNGPTRVPVKHGVLRDELLERKVQTGDRLAIRYLGEKVGEKSGRTYFAYKVAVAEQGPRDQSKAFSLKPREEDSGDEFTPEAEAAVVTEEAPF